MKHEIVFAPEAIEDLDGLRATDRSQIMEAIEVHLRYEPEKTSKSRIKRLQGVEWPQYRLRVDNFRVFYDVIYSVDTGTVEILAIKDKEQSIAWLMNNTRSAE